MARLIALEWDAREARVVVGRSRGKDLLVEQAFTVELLPRDPGQTFADVNVGQKVSAALAARGVSRGETLVALGRANIELRVLQLPAAPPDELPDMVRFQALRQFATIADDWSVDFVELQSSGEGPLNVLAAAISPELIRQIRETCQAGELVPSRLVLRPFAAASLLRRSGQVHDGRCRMLVDVLADEADLTVLVDDQVAFLRTVRLPAEGDEALQARALLGEIRRTIGAAQNQLRDRRVEEITLCGLEQDHAAIRQLLDESLRLPVSCFDPFAPVGMGRELKEHRPLKSGRYAPLLGMLADEAAGVRQELDFLNPRQRPKVEGRGRRVGLLAGLAASVVLLGAFLIGQRIWSLDSEIEDLQRRSRELDKPVAWSEERLAEVALIDEFTSGDVTWLDELHRLSDRMLLPDEARVTKLNLSARPLEGGRMIVEGYVRESEMISRLEDRLRDKAHRVVGKGGAYDELRRQFPWRFNETILVEREESDSSDQESQP